jgi:hypothetical protein
VTLERLPSPLALGAIDRALKISERIADAVLHGIKTEDHLATEAARARWGRSQRWRRHPVSKISTVGARSECSVLRESVDEFHLASVT